jgi:hypothetical protein
MYISYKFHKIYLAINNNWQWSPISIWYKPLHLITTSSTQRKISSPIRVLLVLFSVSAMCWACTEYSAHGVQVSGCYYTSHLNKKCYYQRLRRKSSYKGTRAAQNFPSFRLILHVLHSELNKSNLWSHFKRHHLLYESQRLRSDRIVWDAVALRPSWFLGDDVDLPWELEIFYGCVLEDQKNRQTSGMTSRKIRKTVSTAHKSH